MTKTASKEQSLEWKPCPFHEHVDKGLQGQYGYNVEEDKGTAYIYCADCGASGPHKFGENAASEAWNTRV